MESDGKSSTPSNRKSIRKTSDTSAPATKPIATTPVSSACSVKPHGKAVASPVSSVSVSTLKPTGVPAASTKAMQRPGKSHASSASDKETLLFRDILFGPHAADLRFRLVHFWEARNPRTKTLIGEEMLLIDEEGHVIQGFIPAARVDCYLPQLVAGTVYQLSNFFGSNNKENFRVPDHIATVSFSWNSRLSILQNSPVQFPEDRFRFHSLEEFQANCDQRGDLYDFLGHLKLVNSQAINDHLILDEVTIAKARHVLLHVQIQDGPVVKLYVWDQACRDFCQKFKSSESTPRVVLVTTVNPKQIRGTFALGTMSSSRVFIDNEVEPTRDYLSWLSSNQDIANKTNAKVVTKPETVTIEELFSYMEEGAKVAWFECTATIDDVFQGSSWYYISCAGCNTKATTGPTSLFCDNPKCKKDQVVGIPQCRTRISVYDKSDAGRELTGKHASELVASYIEAHEDSGGDQSVPVPQALFDCIGETYKFVVKVSEH